MNLGTTTGANVIDRMMLHAIGMGLRVGLEHDTYTRDFLLRQKVHFSSDGGVFKITIDELVWELPIKQNFHEMCNDVERLIASTVQDDDFLDSLRSKQDTGFD